MNNKQQLKFHTTMKKIFLIIAATIMVSTAAQSQVLTVKGKTREGKSINVQYTKGAGQDYIESVKYQLVDELKAENQKKQNSINDLQYQLNKANKRIDNLSDQLKKSGNSSQNTEMQEQLNQKQSEIDALNARIEALNKQLEATEQENSNLHRQLDSIKEVNRQLSLNKQRQGKSPLIGVEVGMGTVFMAANKLNNPWEKNGLTWNKQADIYFGTGRLMEGFPLSAEVGIGFRSLPMSAIIKEYEIENNQQVLDVDNMQFTPIYDFNDYTEKLTMNCVELPIRLCIGQPNKDKVSLYAKVGVTPSLILSSKLSSGGTYSKKGYYDDWNVTFEDIEELGFTSEAVEDSQTVTADTRFNLWANAAFGAYVPLSPSLFLNLGAKVDYPILKASSFQKDIKESITLPDGLTKYSGRMPIPNLQAGIVYTLN